jgi:hypothetical protein
MKLKKHSILLTCNMGSCYKDIICEFDNIVSEQKIIHTKIKNYYLDIQLGSFIAVFIMI